MSSVNVICAHCDNVYTMGNIHVCPPNPPETPALDRAIEGHKLVGRIPDAMLVDALTEIRALLKGKL